MNFSPEIDGDGLGKRRFCGIWSKNRWEWLASLLAMMRVNTTSVGFFDAMGADAVDFIVNQTELATMFCSNEYIAKILEFKQAGSCKLVTKIINFDNDTTPEQMNLAKGLNLTITNWNDVQRTGKEA